MSDDFNPQSTSENFNINDYWGCSCCDLLVKKHSLNYHQKATCPRCLKTLAQPIKNSIEKTLALSIGALILFFPAIFLPLMTLNLLGFNQQQSIFQSILAVYNEGYMLVAGVILITCIIVPFLKISILFYVSLSLSIGTRFRKYVSHPLMISSFRIYHSIEEWGMLEIYMLAVLVSVVKLEAMAELHFNLGLILFTALLLLTLLSSAFLDQDLFWETIDRRKNSFEK